MYPLIPYAGLGPDGVWYGSDVNLLNTARERIGFEVNLVNDSHLNTACMLHDPVGK